VSIAKGDAKIDKLYNRIQRTMATIAETTINMCIHPVHITEDASLVEVLVVTFEDGFGLLLNWSQADLPVPQQPLSAI